MISEMDKNNIGSSALTLTVVENEMEISCGNAIVSWSEISFWAKLVDVLSIPYPDQ